MDAPQTHRTVGTIRRRLRLGALVAAVGWGLTAGGVLASAGVLGARLAGLEVAWWVVLAGALGLGLLAGLGVGLARRFPPFRAARRADVALGLRDRLSNALAFQAKSGPLSAGEQLAIWEGERVAAGVDARAVAPIRFGSAWVVWPSLVLAAVACGLFVPERSWEVTEASQREVSRAEREAASAEVANAAMDARAESERALGSGATSEELDRISEIERELTEGRTDPAEALAESASQLESLAERVRGEAEVNELADQSVREELARSLDDDLDSELARALADGDLERARREAEALLEQRERLSPEERERLADELDRLAERLSRQTPTDAPEGPSPEGLDAPEAGEEATPERLDDIRERLEREGMDPEAAERLAEQIAGEQRQRRAEEEAREDVDALSEAAREAAQELREPPPPPDESEPDAADEPGTQADSGDEAGPEGAKPDRSPPDGGEQGREGQPREGRPERGEGQERTDGGQDRSQEGDPGRSEGAERGEERGEAEQGAEQRSGEQQGEASEQQGREGQASGEQQTGERQAEGRAQAREGEERGAEERQGAAEGEGGAEQEGARRESGEPGAEGAAEETGSDRPGEDTGAEEGGEGPARLTDGQGEAPDARGVERLRRELERMSERGERAREQRESAERLRERAERMLEEASPEQRRELEELARELSEGGSTGGREGGSGRQVADGPRATEQSEWRFEDVDAGARADGEPGESRVLSEWFGEEGERPAGRAGAGEARDRSRVLEEAARGAERAVERRAVPRERRELIRRVFERYRQRAEQTGGDADGSGG